MIYEPKVSIIIPVYNGSNFLTEAIDSALAQTYKNCEIIVINDGSTDNGASERIAVSYGDKIRYFAKENGGVSSALNYAFEKMTGQWFSWLSHDDLYYPQKIERQVDFLNKLIQKGEQVDINKITIRTATESIDRDGKVLRRPSYRSVPEYELPIDTILNNVYSYRLSGCSFLLPAACIKDVGGFNEKIRTVSDVEYWYRLLFAGYEFYCLSDDVLVKNRSHGKQVGKTKVTLFERELNDLFISIADSMNRIETYATLENNEKLYVGLVKRRCHRASNYVRETYLMEKECSGMRKVRLNLRAGCYAVLGMSRNILRDIYRLVNVK